MRILIISNRHWYHVAHGVERFLPMSRYLAQRGHQVNLVYLGREMKTHDDYKLDWSNAKYFSIDDAGESRLLLVPDLRGKRTKLHRLGRQGSEIADILASLKEVGMGSSLLLRDYDVVHVEYLFDWPLTAAALITKSLRRAPHVVDFVDLIAPLVRPRKWQAMLYKVGYLPTWATVVSDYLGSYLVSKGFDRQRIFKIPMGVAAGKVRRLEKEEAREMLGLNREQQLVGFELGTGMLDEYVDLALASLRELLKRRKGVKLVFIGSLGDWTYRIRGRAGSMGLDRSVICTGVLRTEELSPWLGACDVLILPLRDSAYDQARFPGRFGDYLAAGRPIVGTTVGETQNILRRGCGLLAKPDNHMDFASKILALLKDDELMRRMGDTGRRLAEGDYSWRNLAGKLEEAYKEIAASH